MQIHLWNSYGSNPPVIVDKDGAFYGYFTVNKSKAKKSRIWTCFDLIQISRLNKG